MTRNRLNDDGAILPLFAMLIFAIIIILAFVIDTARFSTANREKSRSADSVALAFLQGYYTFLGETSSPFDANVQKRAFARGLNAAVRTGRLNEVTPRIDSASTDLVQLQNIIQDLAPGHDATDPVNSNYNNTAGRLGRVEIGLWFSERPAESVCTGFTSISFQDDGNNCPCGANLGGGNESFGCFVRCNANEGCINIADRAGPRVAANAVRISLHTDRAPGGGIQSLFGSLSGMSEVQIERTGTAAISPRMGVVLFDLSRSTTADTHYQWQKNVPAGRRRAEYAFKCDGVCGNDLTYGRGVCVSGIKDDLYSPWPSPAPFTPKPPAVTGLAYSAGYAAAYADLPGNSSPSNVGVFCSAFDEHCVRDYQCVRVDRNGDGVGDAGEDYLVDIGFTGAATDPTTKPKLPQPHTYMLEAGQRAIALIKKNAGPGDRLGLIGFDRTVDTNAAFADTSRYLKPAPVVAGTLASPSTFDKIEALLDPSPAKRRYRAERYFFPGTDEFNDLPLAVWHATNMLKRTLGYESASGYILLISPGLSSCFRSSEQETPLVVTPRCDTSFDTHQASLSELLNYRVSGNIAGHLEREKIRLHTIMVGAQVAPHFIAVKKYGESRCMTEAELRAANLYTALPDTTPGAYQSSYAAIGRGVRPPPRYIGAATWLTAAARRVGGLWIPLQTDSSTDYCGSIASPPCPDWRDKIDQTCRDRAVPNVPGPYLTSQTAALAAPGSELEAHGVPTQAFDPAGRIFCDPQCRESSPSLRTDPVEQVLSEMFKGPPMKLVEDPRRDFGTSD